MAILNTTPDSFSDGGRFRDVAEAVEGGLELLEEGANVVDLGGESTRPGAETVAAKAQLDRVLPVLRGLRDHSDAPVSIDTRDPIVGQEALEAGADIINDVSGFRDPGWGEVLRGRNVPLVVMHMRGTPRDMMERTEYAGAVVDGVVRELGERLAALERAGIERSRCLVDPGFGFAKDSAQCVDLLRGLPRLADLGRPVVVGLSRKSFLGQAVGRPAGDPRSRDIATVAANAFALCRGASVLRVHEVSYTRDLVDVYQAVFGGSDD